MVGLDVQGSGCYRNAKPQNQAQPYYQMTSRKPMASALA